jgi:hypothetical protein
VRYLGELKNKTYLNALVPIWLAKEVRQLSKDSRISLAKLAEEAWIDLLIKHNVDVEKANNLPSN